MKRPPTAGVRLISLLLVAAAVAAPDQALAAGREHPIVAFVGVHVLPMTGEEMIEHQTVVVVDGRIVVIGPAVTVEVPETARVVSGRGKYLLPGLCDMHMHLRSEDELELYLATGVTTVRNMSGQPRHVELRERLETGELLGPRFTTTGPVMQTLPSGRRLPSPFEVVSTADEARASVREQARIGYDAIKIHRFITDETLSPILETAGELGLPVVGHVPDAVDTADAIRGGQSSIEHLTGYDSQIDELDSLIDLTIEHGTWNCFSLSPVWTNENIEALQAAEPDEVIYVIPRLLERWRTAPIKIRGFSKYEKILMALHESGARLMLGTDTGTPYNIPGFAVHQELRLAVEAGLTPYDALRYATVTPAAFLGEAADAGTIEIGKRADLVLLEANPLADITASLSIRGVMVRGVYLDRERLDVMLEEVAAANRRPQDSGAPEGGT
jgi:imidazolonepropionase-like amidohydrolase